MRKYQSTEDNYDFKSILNLCSKYCHYFTLTERDQLNYKKENPKYDQFLNELSPYRVKTYVTPWWFACVTTPQNPMIISVFLFNQMTAAILSRYSEKLFPYDNDGKILDLPEDLCFFREDKTLFLGTITHNRFAVFILNDHEANSIVLPDGFREEPEFHCTVMLPL